MKRIVSILSISLISFALSSVALAEGMNQEQFNKFMTSFLTTDDGQKTVGEATQKYFQKLQKDKRKVEESKRKGELEDAFKKPVVVDAGDSPFKGPADAKVTIIEFSDFECPFCTRGKKTMEDVAKAYPKDVKVVFKNLPLAFHKNAEPAAKAALAAHKQGKFWEMHDKLFDNQRALNDEFYMATAKELGLDVDKFKADMASDDITKQIEADKELAKKHGITGTPGFFVNGVPVKGAYPLDHFKGIIDRWLSDDPTKAPTKKG